MFSLGCILLEIMVLHERGTLDHIRQHRSPDPSFHANLDQREIWCSTQTQAISYRRRCLAEEVKSMLMEEPSARPTAEQLLIRVTGYDLSHMTNSKHSIFRECCRSNFSFNRDQDASIIHAKNQAQEFEEELGKLRARVVELRVANKNQEIVIEELNHSASSVAVSLQQCLGRFLLTRPIAIPK
jgi:hypothetical protein